MSRPASILAVLMVVAGMLLALPVRASDLSNADENRKVMREMVSCTISRSYRDSHGDRLTPYFKAAGKSSREGLTDALSRTLSDCVNEYGSSHGETIGAVATFMGAAETLRTSTTIFRGQVFRAMFVKHWYTVTDRRLAAIRDFIDLPASDPYTPVINFGKCVIARDSENSRKAITSPVGSADEDAAYTALMPSFSACLTPGDTMHLSSAEIEGALSEALFVQAFDAAHKMEETRAN